MRSGSLKIKEKSYLTDAHPSIRHANKHCGTLSAKTTTLSVQHTCRVEILCHCSCNIYACWPSVTVTNTAAVQTCQLVEYCCKMEACWPVATQSACLLTFCLSILHVCWHCASLSAIPAGMVSHFQPCLLVKCLTISRVCWYSVSLSAMPAGVVNH